MVRVALVTALVALSVPASADTTVSGPVTFGTGLSIGGSNGKTVSIAGCGSGTLAYTDCVQSWTKPQRGAQVTVSIATSTFTPDLSAAQHFSIALDHTACPCTIANPANLGGASGQVGIIDVAQSAGGNDGVTWGSAYKFANGTPPVLSTVAGADDFFSYYVKDATHVVVAVGVLNAQ